jgi:Holliday junction resolvasome RuvABC endonuclease subunit
MAPVEAATPAHRVDDAGRRVGSLPGSNGKPDSARTHAFQAKACVLGVDPGLSGALAFYFPDAPSRVAVEDMPVAGGAVDAANLASLIARFQPDFVVVERVASMPRQGVASTFKFGVSYGAVVATLAALQIQTRLVVPGTWKRHFKLGADKEQARALALRLFPMCAAHFSRKKHHGRAEATLIALFGAHQFPGASTPRENGRPDCNLDGRLPGHLAELNPRT